MRRERCLSGGELSILALRNFWATKNLSNLLNSDRENNRREKNFVTQIDKKR